MASTFRTAVPTMAAVSQAAGDTPDKARRGAYRADRRDVRMGVSWDIRRDVSRDFHQLARLALAALGLALSLGLGAAEPPARDKALADLQAASSVTRLAAVKRLGEVGLTSDADALITRLSDDDMQVRAAAAQAVWLAWGRTGDAAIDAQYKRGLQQLGAGDLDEAIATYSLIVRNRPDFAEAWNKRATAHYLRGDFKRSLKDCDEVFKLNPKHFGALAGASQIHARLGQPERALELFKRALAVNPNMDDASEMIRVLQKQIDAKRGDMI